MQRSNTLKKHSPLDWQDDEEEVIQRACRQKGDVYIQRLGPVQILYLFALDQYGSMGSRALFQISHPQYGKRTEMSYKNVLWTLERRGLIRRYDYGHPRGEKKVELTWPGQIAVARLKQKRSR